MWHILHIAYQEKSIIKQDEPLGSPCSVIRKKRDTLLRHKTGKLVDKEMTKL